jgi:two-component system chemotaxis response regulator CheY
MEPIDKTSIKNILIVDDSSTAQMIIKRCFEISGFTDNNYVFASNGLEALDILKTNKIDLIITDLNMPKLNGNNLIKLIKADEKTKNIIIVIATSLGESSTVDDLCDMGIKFVIKKPVTPNKIMELFKL